MAERSAIRPSVFLSLRREFRLGGSLPYLATSATDLQDAVASGSRQNDSTIAVYALVDL